jgi:GH35 family endo-1,4-beta-xylanase
MTSSNCRCLSIVLLLFSPPVVFAQTTLDGSALVYRSTGSGSNGDWTIDRNGYVGTYVTLAAPGSVTVDVSASGTASGGTDPHMNIVLADTKVGFDVGGGSNSYQHTFDLPAGTHFLRTELNNDLESSSRALTIENLTVTGATVSNSDTDSNALAAADTYIANYRRGASKVSLVGLAPGTQVDVKLKRHEFNFGTAIPNSFTDTFLSPPGSPNRNPNADQFQQALADSKFNSLTPENAGKWDANEGTRDVLSAAAANPNGGPNIPYIDRISDYAMEHEMRFRQHNLIWGRNPQGGVNQQPGWADNMAQDPNGIDAATGNTNSVALRDEIGERIDYYVGDRAHRFYEVDIYNESYHTGSDQNHSSNTYWDLYGASGIAGIYKESKDAIAAAGADAKIFVNEYNVLQNQGNDYFANWYVRHFESLQSAGRDAYGEDVVDGIGFQYYASAFGGGAHDPGRIYATMQNLAVQGLPMHLTEFGISSGTTNQSTQADILSEALRLVFGMPDTTGFTMWGFWAGSVWSGAPNGVLYNQDWSLRPTGTAWNDLQAAWDTDLELEVGPDGTIDFTGFYGDYEITIDGQTFDLNLVKGTNQYALVIAPGDYNGNGVVDAADYTVWRDTLGSTTDLRADGNGNFMVDEDDYGVWKSLFGTTYGSGSAGFDSTGALASVPEPTALALIAAGVLVSSACRRSCGQS